MSDPFYLATWPIGGVETPMRETDGSLVIMKAPEPGEENPIPIVAVRRIEPVKRGDRHNAPDPAQEAFARRLIDLLNGEGTYDEGYAAGVGSVIDDQASQ